MYVLQLTGHFQWCIRQSAEVENHLTSCERILEYADLESEATHVGSRPSEGTRVALRETTHACAKRDTRTCTQDMF